MRSISLGSIWLIMAATGFILAGTGCNKSDKKGDPQARSNPKSEKGDGKTDTLHSSWWCAEHGVPEEICSVCMSPASAKKKYKDNGDWCSIHNRAQSQCFKCEPSLYKKYEDMYVAKYGKTPERPPEEEFKK
jgi:hypothetical protein